MGTPYTVEDESAIDAVADADVMRLYDASGSNYKKASIAQVRAGMGAIVSTTATELTLTAASHAGRVLKVASAAPILIRLPAATGTGNKYEIVFSVAATATAHTIKCTGTDDMEGGVAIFDTSATDITAIGFKATATDDTISVDGTTRGGERGSYVTLIDVETGLWAVRYTSGATGSYATPFSATV